MTGVFRYSPHKWELLKYAVGNRSEFLRGCCDSALEKEGYDNLNEELVARMNAAKAELETAKAKFMAVQAQLLQLESAKEARDRRESAEKAIIEDAADRCKACECKLNGNGYQGYCFSCFDPKHPAPVEAAK